MKSPQSRDMQGCLVIVVAVLLIGFVLFRNIQPSISFSLPVPTATGTPVDNSWEKALQSALSDYTMPQASVVAVPPTAYVAPTLPPEGTLLLVQPTQMFV